MLLWNQFQLLVGGPEKRVAAIRDIGRSRRAQAVDILIQALKDRDGQVPIAAAEELGRLGDPRAVAPLVAALHDREEYIREAAAEALGNLGTSAVGTLIEALRDPDTTVRGAAIRALGHVGPPALPALADTLREPSRFIREAAAEALGHIRDERTVPVLIHALSDWDDNVRDKAARALVHVGKVAVPGLLQALNELEAGAVRQRALWALERLGAEPLTETYLRPLGLGKWKDVSKINADTLQALTKALEHDDRKERFTAVQTLANIGDDRAVSGLTIALEDSDRAIRQAAMHALVKIGPGALQSLIDLLQQGNLHLRRQAASMLGYIGDARALPFLLEALTDPDPGLRASAAEALGAFKDPATVEPLLALLRDADAQVRFGAVGALWQIEDGRAIQPLLQVLGDPDHATRTRAAQALGAIGDDQVIEPLLALFEQDPTSRLEAALALRKKAPVRAVRPLIRLALEEPASASEAIDVLAEILEEAADQVSPEDLHELAKLPEKMATLEAGRNESSVVKPAIDPMPPCRLAVTELIRRGLLPLPDPPGKRAQTNDRECSRRPTQALQIQILHGMHQMEPVAGHALDISAGGMGLMADRPYAPGTMMTVRPVNAPPEIPWVLVEIRHSRKTRDGWHLGCKFARSPSYAFEVLFG